MLHAKPVLTRAQVNLSVAARAFLTGSNLAADVELVKFTQLPLTLEELSKLWSVFFQTQYVLSVAYQGTVVLIETDDSFMTPLPVRLRNLYVETFREPDVEAVVAASGDDEPIVAQSKIRVRGRRLKGDTTLLTISGEPVDADRGQRRRDRGDAAGAAPGRPAGAAGRPPAADGHPGAAPSRRRVERRRLRADPADHEDRPATTTSRMARSRPRPSTARPSTART